MWGNCVSAAAPTAHTLTSCAVECSQRRGAGWAPGRALADGRATLPATLSFRGRLGAGRSLPASRRESRRAAFMQPAAGQGQIPRAQGNGARNDRPGGAGQRMALSGPLNSPTTPLVSRMRGKHTSAPLRNPSQVLHLRFSSNGSGRALVLDLPGHDHGPIYHGRHLVLGGHDYVLDQQQHLLDLGGEVRDALRGIRGGTRLRGTGPKSWSPLLCPAPLTWCRPSAQR